MDGLFEFERSFAASLACIPMSVRLKLDCCGVKISLAQWNSLSAAERADALERSCADEAARADWRRWLEERVEARSGEAARALPVDPQPPWDEPRRVPEALNDYLPKRGIAPLTVGEWARLAPLQRFTLLKLCRSNHDSVNLEPALQEFGLAAR